MTAAMPKPRRGVTAAMTRPMPAEEQREQCHGDESLCESLGLVGEVELGQQGADVQHQQGRRGEDEQGRRQRGELGADVVAGLDGPREVQGHGLEAQVAGDRLGRLRGDVQADDGLHDDRVARVVDGQVLRLGGDGDGHHDGGGHAHHHEQQHRQHLGLRRTAEAVCAAQGLRVQREPGVGAAEAGAVVGAVADVVDTGVTRSGGRCPRGLLSCHDRPPPSAARRRPRRP